MRSPPIHSSKMFGNAKYAKPVTTVVYQTNDAKSQKQPQNVVNFNDFILAREKMKQVTEFQKQLAKVSGSLSQCADEQSVKQLYQTNNKCSTKLQKLKKKSRQDSRRSSKTQIQNYNHQLLINKVIPSPISNDGMRHTKGDVTPHKESDEEPKSLARPNSH